MKIARYFPVLAVAIITTVTFTSCYKDKGNYSYDILNDITITDTIATTYTVIQFDTLKISPVVSAKLNSSSLKYEWTARRRDPSNPSGEHPVFLLSTQKALTARISLTPAVYRVILKVTDTVTQISSFLFYQLTVGTNLSRGWMFVQQFANSGDISLLAPTGRWFHHIFEEVNGYPLSKNLHTVEVNTAFNPREVYLLEEDSAREVSPTGFSVIRSFNNWFFTPPSPVKPLRNLVYTPPTRYEQTGILINKGLVHFKRYGGFGGAVLYGPELTLDGAADYAMSRYILMGDMNAARYMAVFYETKSKRFVGLRGPAGGTTANLVAFPDSVAGTAFDPNKVGMDLLYAGNSPQNFIYNAILKHGSGDCYLYRLNLTTATGAMLKQKMNAAGINAMTSAVPSLVLDYIYYSEANNIHMYEVGPNASSPLFSFPAGESVTAMAIESAFSTTVLMVATYNGTEGKVYQFKLNVDGKFMGGSYENMYTGFGKIVQIAYKVP